MSTTILDLATKPWKLACFRPNAWKMRGDINGSPQSAPDFTIDARVPGSAHTACLAAKKIDDWNVGTKSLRCEWIEHRHWEFFTDLEPIEVNTPVTLEADGLDYNGWVLVDAKIIAEFTGTLIRHKFDLTKQLSDGKPHRLSIMFDDVPREQGQVGYTSRVKYFKPRFSYSWDWTPRLVPIGIWDSIRLITGTISGEVMRVRSILNDDHESGRLAVVVKAESAAKVHITLGDQSFDRDVKAGESEIDIDLPKVQRWSPNSEGNSYVYPITIDIDGVRRFESTTGFKHVRWVPNEGATPEQLPWICEINGGRIFLQGVNWTPISVDYAAVTREDYAKRIDLYKAAGVNLVRVWGGAFLEKEIFYELCDRAGILVWQEFPLSSSGLDNAAPTDPETIKTVCTIATDYIRRRGHHACKLMWCGGNELCGEPEKGGSTPHTLAHPMIAALAKVAEAEDPGTRFVPTSPSGPNFSYDKNRRGQHVHEDTHGPWNWGGDMKSWREHWESSDSLFHSEFGFPSASSVEILQRYHGEYPLWPPTRENWYWMHSASWWMEYGRFKDQLKDLPPDQAIAKYVELSQALQAEALSAAAEICKKSFPACGGVLVWMGHDCFPCPANTSIIDFQGNPKPAFDALAKVFTKKTV